MANAELKALHEARVARLAANPSHSEVVLGEGDSLTRVKLVEVPAPQLFAQKLFVACGLGRVEKGGGGWRKVEDGWRRVNKGPRHTPCLAPVSSS